MGILHSVIRMVTLMDCWIPEFDEREKLFRLQSPLRRVRDTWSPLSSEWGFRICEAYLPRKAIWPGDDLCVRFSVENDSAQEGTIYFIVTVRSAYGSPSGRIIYSSDRADDRDSRIAAIAGGETACLQTIIPWTAFEAFAASHPGASALPLSIEIELWVPRRLYGSSSSAWEHALRRLWPGRFHKVTLFANPRLILAPALATCFISYAWIGASGLPVNMHRAWVYSLGDALAQAHVRAVIDYGFLKPADLTRETIERVLTEADKIIIVYSDAYLDRIDRPGSGVWFEYGRITRDPALTSRSFPIRRHVAKEDVLFDRERRLIVSFEDGDLSAAVAVLVRHMMRR